MSLAITATIVGVVAGGLAIGTTVNALANSSAGTSANTPASAAPGSPTIGDLLNVGNANTSQANQVLEQILVTDQNQQATVAGAVTDAEYAALGFAVVSLAAVLFLHKKKHHE